MTKDFSGMFQDVAMGFATGASRTATEYLMKKLDGSDQSNGYRTKYSKRLTKGPKRFKAMNAMRANFVPVIQKLGLFVPGQDTTYVYNKHLVSEFDPRTSGFIKIPNDAQTLNVDAAGMTPLQIFDLNLYCGDGQDNLIRFPVTPTAQCADINARSWYWKNDNSFYPMRDLVGVTYNQPRWYPDANRTTDVQETELPEKIYRNWIDIKFMAYGCKQMPTTYEFSIIQIMDPTMCPDYANNLADLNQTYTDDKSLQSFRQRWQNLIRTWTINPLLNGVEPQPRTTGRWFKTVAKKVVRIGEQTADVETIPTAQGSIRLNLNRINRYAWSEKGFDLESGAAKYDNVPVVDDAGAGNYNFQFKPWYTQRYYLMVRAVSTVEVSTETSGDTWTKIFDGARVGQNFTPSYDLVVSTKFTKLK